MGEAACGGADVAVTHGATVPEQAEGSAARGTRGDFTQVGGAVNTKLVPRSMVDDLMTPLADLDRSISESLQEG